MQPARLGESFGDTVLIQVLRARLFGEGGPRQHSQTPPGGYSAADAAGAVTLVCESLALSQSLPLHLSQVIQAVEEWADGNYQPVAEESDLKAHQHFKDVERLAEKILQNAKDKWPEEWCQLCHAVRTHNPKNYKRAWNMRGLPEAALNSAQE